MTSGLRESLPEILRSVFHKAKHRDSSELFDAILSAAHAVAGRSNAGASLLAITRLVGRSLASDYIISQLGAEGRTDDIMQQWQFMMEDAGCTPTKGAEEKVWLGWDPVVAAPWREERFASSLNHLAKAPASRNAEWKFDHLNHKALLYMPIRLVEVSNGNHSIIAGILSEPNASLPAEYIIDISPAMPQLEFLGVERRGQGTAVWRNQGGNNTRIDDWRLGALFEVGRIMVSLGIGASLGNWRPTESKNELP